MNGGDLLSAFGASVNQTFTDLNRYIGMAPQSTHLDKSARANVCSAEFASQFLEYDVSRNLVWLGSVVDGILDRADAWMGQFSFRDTAPASMRGANAGSLHWVVAAIRRLEVIEVKYLSLSWPKPCCRWFASHAIGFSSARWRTRRFFRYFSYPQLSDTQQKVIALDCGMRSWNV